MPTSETEIRASLDKVIEDVEMSQRVFGWVSGVVGDLAREMRNLTGVVETRFDGLDEHLRDSRQRFAFRLDDLGERLLTIEQQTSPLRRLGTQTEQKEG